MSILRILEMKNTISPRSKLLISLFGIGLGITYFQINGGSPKKQELLTQRNNVISNPEPMNTIRLIRANHQSGASSDAPPPQEVLEPFKTLKRIEKQFVSNSLSFQGAYNRFDRKTVRKELLQEALKDENYQRAAAEILRDPLRFSQQHPQNQAEMRLFAIALLSESSGPNQTAELETAIRNLGKQLETSQTRDGIYPKGIDEDYVDLLARLLELKKPSSPQEIMNLAQSGMVSPANYLQLRRAWIRAFHEQMPNYTLAELN